jgi:hypothetical protein
MSSDIVQHCHCVRDDTVGHQDEIGPRRLKRGKYPLSNRFEKKILERVLGTTATTAINEDPYYWAATQSAANRSEGGIL